MKTQNELVLKHLKKHGSITSRQAFKKYGITRLSSIIHRLRSEYLISTNITNGYNRRKERVCYATYYYYGEKEFN